MKSSSFAALIVAAIPLSVVLTMLILQPLDIARDVKVAVLFVVTTLAILIGGIALLLARGRSQR